MRDKYKKGDFIGNKYEVYDLLGEGGFGIVYLVYSHETKNVYALKTFLDKYIEDRETKERFKREAQVLVDLERHPYLVSAHVVDEISERLYIAMEHIASLEPEMNTLEGYLRRRPPALAQSLRWAIQFCFGMEYAYSRGINAHRDIKPANIMIDQNKTVKIADFGLAGIILDSLTSGQANVFRKVGSTSLIHTACDTSIGTPEYMSPEQFEDLSACDERSDMYSFGIVLYRMASGGILPFSAENPEYRWTVLKHCHQETSVPKLNSLLYPIILKCLEKKPDKRYQKFSELRSDLELHLKRETGEVVKLPELKELDSEDLSNKGVSFISLERNQEALACFEMALEINPRYAVAWDNKGNVLERLGRDQEAIACYDRALEINPENSIAWYNKGCALARRGKNKEAISCYDKALAINPRDTEILYNRGCAFARLGEDQKAITCFDKILEISSRDSAALNNKGNALGRLAKYQEAIACFDKTLEINPGEAAAWSNKGVALGMLGKNQEAIYHYKKALEINPKYADAWFNNGLALAKLGKAQEAISCFDKAIEINRQYANAWFYKGAALDGIGKDHEAIVCYEMTIEINPEYADAWYNKGVSLEKLDEDQEAIACYGKAIEINSKYVDAWFNKGVVLGRRGKDQEAIACYEKVVEINHRHIEAWYNKAQLEDRLKKPEAIISYKNFLKLAPEHFIATTVRKRIEVLEKK